MLSPEADKLIRHLHKMRDSATPTGGRIVYVTVDESGDDPLALELVDHGLLARYDSFPNVFIITDKDLP